MPPLLDLSGRVALVTGASRGIGKAVAERLWQAGAVVVATARTIEPEAFAPLLAERPDSVMTAAGDVADANHCREVLRTVFQTHRRLDVLVNNAGVMPAGMLGMTSDQDVEQAVRVNLMGTLHMTQAAARLMMRNRSGSIINMTSILGRFGKAGLTAYSGAKAGVIGVTLAAAKELAPHQVRVNAVAPGFITTDLTDALAEDVRAEQIAQIGMGRAGSPGDVADTVLFLASDLSRYVTGQVIGVDGAFAI
jgi:3-oxoacyl-[acyl-carrier protein] reductase